jgi:hypothetical protein
MLESRLPKLVRMDALLRYDVGPGQIGEGV